MNRSKVAKIYIIVCAWLVIIGFVLPFLMSAKSTPYVICAITAMVFIGWLFTEFVVDSIPKIAKKIEADKKDETKK